MAYFRKIPSGKWQAIVKHPSGRQITKTDPLKRVVVEWAADVEQRIRRGDFIDPTSGRVTLEAWWRQWLATRRVEKNTTAKNESHWRVHVQPAFGTWPIGSIQSWDVESWVVSMQRAGVGSHTVASAVRLLGQLLAAAVRHRMLARNPVEVVKVPRVPAHIDRILTPEEARALVQAVPAGPHRLFVRLLLGTGLRWSEAAGLHGFRVDLMRRQLQVLEVLERDGTIKAHPKSQAGQRVVPLTDELVAALSAHLAERPRDGLVFTGAQGAPLSYTNWRRRVWAPAVAAAGLAEPVPTPHDCRHSYGSWLAEEGVPPHEIAALMGHSSLRAVERYIHAGEARLERARQALAAR